MPSTTSSAMQMPREPAPAAFPTERTSTEQPRPVQPMTMEQPEMSMRGGKDGGVRKTNSSFDSAVFTNILKAICCGICAGLCCFECLDCCC
ncbi:hypothetical protein FOQG_03849 [Fusarium oxysporum f. sp. raphani 54005]|uniref:Uncharacterized protein n=4 Tax=Fusarium oxysporum TaxID=5507 RepID=X0CM34_FUSOX|nr:hypothetical protein FOZG_12590 [Fusarium oxysporum Fo47]EWZ95225.1 hypothetical protein FOWG_05194 [Fusarium oxysporum f. sp. lycopersici MN25]EXA38630.1 hypothetical protein FOVG_10513 [Fusarium oxysporum f. sp. pisi HDV247]EXK95216.1 hypothetical protein FOQG_03849 [Fusarium oxysporum f. sp. raphani 54005]EXL48393.1 hypothetical protein FOCG_10819 [Fusarium oxysporum f. sp. radicis-lycopersici 26381]EXL83275.1 hypothetical protein FOPG_03859 [Fusarium oxysporum f. sp. conglutinans race 2